MASPQNGVRLRFHKICKKHKDTKQVKVGKKKKKPKVFAPDWIKASHWLPKLWSYGLDIQDLILII